MTFFEIDNADVIKWKEDGLRRCKERYPDQDYSTPKYGLKRVGADLREEGTAKRTTTHYHIHSRMRPHFMHHPSLLVRSLQPGRKSL